VNPAEMPKWLNWEGMGGFVKSVEVCGLNVIGDNYD